DRVAEYIKTNPVEASGAGFDIEPAGRDYRDGPEMNLSTSADDPDINALWRATNPDALSPTPSPTFMREFNNRDLPDEVYAQHPDLVARAYDKAENDLQPERVAEYIAENPDVARAEGVAESTEAKTEPKDGDSGKTEPTDGDSGKTEPTDGDSGKTERTDGDGGKTEPKDGDSGKTEPTDGDSGKTEPTDGDSGKTEPTDGDSGKTEPKDGDGGKTETDEAAAKTDPEDKTAPEDKNAPQEADGSGGSGGDPVREPATNPSLAADSATVDAI